VASTPSARGKPKGDKRDRTRAALLEAARALIREKGYERTTMEEVARRAGMTTGAIYGNFKNREELFIALGQKYWAPIVPRVPPGATFAETMRAFAEATLAAVHDRTPVAVGRLTGLAYTLKNSELRARVHDITKSSYEFGAEWLDLFERSELPMPPKQLVRVIHALIEGLVMQRILTPDLCPDEVFYEAFAARQANDVIDAPRPAFTTRIWRAGRARDGEPPRVRQAKRVSGQSEYRACGSCASGVQEAASRRGSASAVPPR
jgi:AcrR family transcriptional regulator